MILAAVQRRISRARVVSVIPERRALRAPQISSLPKIDCRASQLRNVKLLLALLMEFVIIRRESNIAIVIKDLHPQIVRAARRATQAIRTVRPS